MFHYSVGDLLIDDAVVGRELENIDLHFRYEENDFGERVFQISVQVFISEGR